jgi:hypothetical protein
MKLPLDNILPFYRFIYARQSIWHKRTVLMQKAPWTDDAVLVRYKFCNVYRELDKGTITLTNFIQNADRSVEEKLYNIIAYRFFNKHDTFSTLFRGGLNPKSFNVNDEITHFDALHKNGPIFNDAYVISPQVYKAGERENVKHVQILHMLNDLRSELPNLIQKLNTCSGADMLLEFQKIPFIGPFIAGQILLDCTYSTNTQNKQDLTELTANDFLIVGPGAHWGLDILWNTKLSKKDADAACRYLFSMQTEAFDYLTINEDSDFSTVRWQNANYHGGELLALHDIQNSLCEFRKHHRLTHEGAGRKRIFKTA